MPSELLSTSSLQIVKKSEHKPMTILRCKVVIVGDACTGKTSFSQVFALGGANFPKTYLMTSETEYCVKQIQINGCDANTIIELHIFDCAGQSIFNQLDFNSKAFAGASAVMILFDISSNTSLQAVPKWHNDVSVASEFKDPLVALVVGNKADLREDKSRTDLLSSIEIQRITSVLDNVQYQEVSTATGAGVQIAFQIIATEFYKRYIEKSR